MSAAPQTGAGGASACVRNVLSKKTQNKEARPSPIAKTIPSRTSRSAFLPLLSRFRVWLDYSSQFYQTFRVSPWGRSSFSHILFLGSGCFYFFKHERTVCHGNSQ